MEVNDQIHYLLLKLVKTFFFFFTFKQTNLIIIIELLM